MDKWDKLRATIQELHNNNADKPDVVNVTHFLLNLMGVLDGDNKGCTYYEHNDKMPPMCHDCPHRETAKPPYYCPDCEQEGSVYLMVRARWNKLRCEPGDSHTDELLFLVQLMDRLIKM